MKRPALFAALMAVLFGAVGGVKFYMATESAAKAQSVLSQGVRFQAQVLTVSKGARRGGNASVRLLAHHDPAGGDQPASVVVTPDAFDDLDLVRPGQEVAMIYDPATRASLDLVLATKRAHWRWWIFR